MPKKVFIYCLKDPTTGDVRYIGKTYNFKERLKGHLNCSSKLKGHLGNWLRSLKGKTPILAVLHEVSENESWQEEERRYISCARALGVDLVNMADGGEGNPGPMSPKRRVAAIKQCAAMSAAKMGMPNSPEHCAAISAALTGRPRGPHSPEARAAISATLKGVPKGPRSPEHCAAISASKKGVPSSLEARAAQSAAQRGVPWSPARRAAYEAGKLAKPTAK